MNQMYHHIDALKTNFSRELKVSRKLAGRLKQTQLDRINKPRL